MLQAIPEQLGLELSMHTGQVETFVIDHAGQISGDR
jgi:uncharacterized protein (TIGR03435 family)